jgi:hypothetical protein
MSFYSQNEDIGAVKSTKTVYRKALLILLQQDFCVFNCQLWEKM